MNNLRHKSIKAFLWDLMGRFTGQGIGFVISIILARILAPADFGLLAMVNVVIALGSVMMDMGLGSALIQRQEIKGEHYGSVFYFNIAVGISLAAALFFSAAAIANFYHRPEIKILARVMSLNFIITSFCNVQRLWLKKQLNYIIPTKASIVGMITGGTIGVGMAFSGLGVWSLVAQTLISGITNNLYIYYFTQWKPKLIWQWKALQELWGFGFNMFLSSALNTIFTQLDSLIIGKIFTPATLGFYFRAKSLDRFIINYTSASLTSILFPALSSIQNDQERYKQVVYRSFHLLNFVTFLLLGILFLSASDIIVLLFSEKWLPAVEYYRIIVLAGFIYPFSALLMNIISSKGNSKAFLKLEIYKQVVIALAYIIGFWFGIKGFLYGMVIAYFFALKFNISFASKEMEVNNNWFYKIISKYFYMGTLIAGVFWWIDLYLSITNRILHLALFGGGFTLLYLLASYTLKLEGFLIFRNEFGRLNLKARILTMIKHKT